MSTTRERLTEQFRTEGIAYCCRLAPVKHWANGKAQFCYLPLGHEGKHQFAPKWVSDEKLPRRKPKKLGNSGPRSLSVAAEETDL